VLEGGLDLLYRQALAAPHEPYMRTEVWSGGTRIIDDLVLQSGNVGETLTSRVSRVYDFTVTEDLYPVDPGDALAPFGNHVQAYRGIRFAEGTTYSWPVFRGKIDEVHLDDQGLVTVHCEDRAAEVIDDTFEVPRNSDVGDLATTQVRTLIDEALPDAQFGPFDEFFNRMPILTWEHDRGNALDEIATSLGAFWYPLADGRFVLRRYPWTVPGTPVVTLADGPGGTITGSSAVRDRHRIYNSVTVTGERADGTPPSFATVHDDDPTSPTFIDGPFGRRNLLRKLRTPLNSEACRAAARQLLHRATALTEAWTFSAVPDAALELGDVIALDVRGRQGVVQVVASISMPMDTKGIMNVGCRALVVGQLEEVG
jgi:hypothetical protein